MTAVSPVRAPDEGAIAGRGVASGKDDEEVAALDLLDAADG